MEESTIKGMKSLELNDRDAAVGDTLASKVCCPSHVEKMFRFMWKDLSCSCYQEVEVCGSIPPICVALMRFVGEDAKDKALILDGTDVGRWIPIVKSTLWQSYPFASSFPSNLSSYMLFVPGYDTGLAEFDIQIALSKHFSSCGEVTRVTVFPASRALDVIKGERCEEKALHLNGSFMGGMNLVVEPPKQHSGPRKFASRTTTGYMQPSPSVLLAKKKIKKQMEKGNM